MDRLTISVPEAGRLLGISRASAFALAGKPGGIPIIRLGRRLLVPKAALEKKLLEVEGGEKCAAK
ncbi:MAG: DNA-binding protein [Dehalococcoidia bacterium]|nr:DNA-binding protein [Dehalococcoidia bacterium]